MNHNIPWRLLFAQYVCRYLPPSISQHIRNLLYPQRIAYQDKAYVEVRAQTGSLYCGNIADYHIYPFSIHGYFYWRAWAVALAVCSQGDAILEIGANIGTETIGFSDIVGPTGRVMAFEPLPANLKILQDALKKRQYDNIEIHPVAVGASNQQMRFSVPPNPEHSGVGYVVNQSVDNQQETMEVTCVALDAFLPDSFCPKLIYMDVEGFEIQVLRGAYKTITTHKPALILESSQKLLKRAGFSVGELYKEVAHLGYVPFGIALITTVELNAYSSAIDYTNWLCLPKEKLALRSVIHKAFFKCGLLPCIPGINPMTRIVR